MKTKKQTKLDEARVSRLFARAAEGRQVPIMSLGRIMAAGLRAVDAGGDDAAVSSAISEAVRAAS